MWSIGPHEVRPFACTWVGNVGTDVNALRRGLTEMVRRLRTLFVALGFEVRNYSDVQLVEDIIALAPDIHRDWPTNDEMRRAFKRLIAK